MYLNKLKIGSTKAVCTILILIGSVVWFITILFLIFSFRSLDEGVEYLVAGSMALILFGGVATALTVPPALLIRRMYRAEKYDRIFEEDHDGMVSYEVFSRLTGFSVQKVRSDIRVLTEKNIFRNITYGWEGAMIIMKPETEGDFISVDCPNCGASINMRMNGGARCQHCGTYMRSESQNVH
ncbi:MAG: hypothetical protein K5871_01370 [Lachnospiraceae bacterium]|nr:hypothetical protein [Lachnospiraceae bacterium]